MKSFYQYLGEQSPEQEGMNATNIVHPSFLMCPPFNLYAGNQNNVFMTFADVHVNRVPYGSILEYKMLEPIQSFNYSMTGVEEKIFGKAVMSGRKQKGVSNLYLNNNARMLNRFYIPSLNYSYYVVQVADYDVNMILHFNTEQKKLYHQGDRFSFVRWGSQCDIILPLRKDLNIQPLIPEGMHVEAGVDKVASLL